jgi:hypothetical protein
MTCPLNWVCIGSRETLDGISFEPLLSLVLSLIFSLFILSVGSGDRSERIRTYNFPQGRVTDHRINATLYKLDRVLAGESLDELIDPLIAADQAEKLAELE